MNLPIIGDHTTLKVYAQYDRSVLFSIRNTLGTLYIMSLADETDTADVWLAAPMTQQQVQELESGLPLRHIFEASTGGVLRFEVPFGSDGHDAAVSVISQSRLSELEDELPTAEYRLPVSQGLAASAEWPLEELLAQFSVEQHSSSENVVYLAFSLNKRAEQSYLVKGTKDSLLLRYLAKASLAQAATETATFLPDSLNAKVGVYA